MIEKNRIWIRKKAAGLLLLLLFSITILQLSHSHTYNAVSQEQKKNFFKKYSAGIHYNTLSESKCYICEYQLTKDSDTGHSLSPLNYPALFNNSLPASYFIILSAAYSVFENRGPPYTA